MRRIIKEKMYKSANLKTDKLALQMNVKIRVNPTLSMRMNCDSLIL